MSIAMDTGLTTTNEGTEVFDLLNLPLETQHYVLSFLRMNDIVNFAFVCRRTFEVAKGLTWDNLDFSHGDYWFKDVANLCDRAKATCQSVVLPKCRYSNSSIYHILFYVRC
jgi:hypothetical protein